MALTQRQHQVLSFLRSFSREHGYCPSYQEIADGLGLSSLATVHAHIATLESKRLIRRQPNQSRSIEFPRKRKKRPAPPPPAAGIPLLGRIAAGAPIEAIPGRVEFSLADITGNREVFMLEVRGDSMQDDHIVDGDYVLVEKRERAENGQIVVALVDGAEATLKRIYVEGGMVRLQPANPRFAPLRLAPARVQVQGRVIGVMRKV